MFQGKVMRLNRRRLIAVLGAALPVFRAGSAASQSNLPKCTQSATIGAWSVKINSNEAALYTSMVENTNYVFSFRFSVDRENKIKYSSTPFAVDGMGVDEYSVEIWGDDSLAASLIYKDCGDLDDFADLDDDDEYCDGYVYGGDFASIFRGLAASQDLLLRNTENNKSYTISSDGFSAAVKKMFELHESIQSSYAAFECRDPLGGGAGLEGCFITTASCEFVGLPDDCFELRSLRRFRDEYLAQTPEGRREIMQYYAAAPEIAARLRREPGKRQLRRLYRMTILPCAILSWLNLNQLTHFFYRRMMTRLAQ